MMSDREKLELLRTIRVVLENGDRLAKDAEYLCEMDRFPSAFALCILAKEEYAKAFMLHLVHVEAIPWTVDRGHSTSIERPHEQTTCRDDYGFSGSRR